MAGCGSNRPVITNPAFPPVDKQAHVPDFARRPFAPFSRADAVAIALHEWQGFGSPVDDDPPNLHVGAVGDAKPERQPGYWQRIGEYWWLGQDADSPQNGWTGKHDSFGIEYPATEDEGYAWSAAFISYIMRTAGAGTRFPYSASHSTYINIGARMAQRTTQGWALVAERPDSYAPLPGDLICHGRRAAKALHYEDLPAGQFTSHCDIVVDTTPGSLTVIGGNVDDAVTMKHIPTTTDGRLQAPNGQVVDPRYPWMTTLRILYER